MGQADIYTLLQVDRGAGPQEIASAFHRFARSNHPDLFPGDVEKEARLKAVTAAYHQWKVIQDALREMRRLRYRSNGPLRAHGVPVHRYTWVA